MPNRAGARDDSPARSGTSRSGAGAPAPAHTPPSGSASVDWQAVVAALGGWQEQADSHAQAQAQAHAQAQSQSQSQAQAHSHLTGHHTPQHHDNHQSLAHGQGQDDQAFMALVQQMYGREAYQQNQTPQGYAASPSSGVHTPYYYTPPTPRPQPGPGPSAGAGAGSSSGPGHRRVAPAPPAAPASTPSGVGAGQGQGQSRGGTRAGTVAPTAPSTPGGLFEDAEDKRVRNTLASARFRAKKKAHVENVERNIRALEAQHAELEVEVADLRKENGLLKDMVQLKYGAGGGP